MTKLLRITLLTCLISVMGLRQAEASHAMGADLTYVCTGPNQYEVTLSFYRDCYGITPLTSYTLTASSASCGQTLTFSAPQVGSAIEVSPLCPADIGNSTCNGGALPGVQQYIFTGTVNLPMACTDWVFSFREGNRNAAITTISAPGSAWLYVEATLNNVDAPCNNSPVFSNLPVPFICLGQPYIYNHGAIDADGDSLVYTLIDALDNAGAPVTYLGGFSGTNPMTSSPATTINGTNGNVSVTPTAAGEVAVIAVLVEEYRNGVLIGSTIRDIQVTVLNCTNNNPNVNPVTNVTGAVQSGPYTVEVCPGTPISFDIPGVDADAGDVLSMTWNSGIPGGSFSSTGNVTGTFSWTPGPGDVGYHTFTVAVVDDACPAYGSQTVAIEVIVVDRTTAGPDLSYCIAGGPVQLNAQGGSIFTWNVLAGGPGNLSCNPCPDPLASPPATTTYEVVSDLSGACVNRDTVTVTLVPDFTLGLIPDSTICLGGTIDLATTVNPGGAYTFNWTPSSTLSSPSDPSPTATPTDTTRYYVEVESALGCRITDSVDVAVVDMNLSQSPTAVPTNICDGDPVDLNANVSNGDCSIYNLSSIPYNSVGGGGWTSIALSDDATSPIQPIGFTFNFYCNDYTNFYISSNGGISFSGDYMGTAPSAVPTAATPNNAIFLCWDDLNPSSGGTIRYKTIGAAPNRQLIVEFSNVDFFGSTLEVSGQIQLFETSNDVEIHMSEVGLSGVHSMGIENIDGTSGLSPAGYNNTTYTIASNMAWRFSPQSGTPYTVSWQAPLGNTIASTDNYTDYPSTNTTYYSVLQDAGGICPPIIQSVVVDVANTVASGDTAICTGGSAQLNANYSGPPPMSQCDQYVVSSIPYAPLGGGSPTTLALGDDQVSAAIPIGFNFEFFCNTYSSIYISSNGFATFNAASGSGCCSGSTLPTATINNFIAGCWNDLYPPGGGTISYLTSGTAPNRIFRINFQAIPHCCSATPINTFQILLYESTNVIDIHSNTITDDGSTHTQGIQDATGTNWFGPAGWQGTNYTTTNTSYRYTPQVTALTYTWTPAGTLSDPSISNPVASPGSPTWYYVTVDNGYCSMLDSVFVDINCILPVELISLEGERREQNSYLTWSTASETGSSHFTVQRRNMDGSFDNIGQVNAAGNSQSERNYAFTDFDPLNGSNVYRLMVHDQNGSAAATNSVEVIFESEASLLSVYPNPTEGLVHFTFQPGDAQSADLRIYDLAGKTLYSSSYTGFGGVAYEADADLSGLADGVYLYELRVGEEKFYGKLNIAH